MKSALISMLVCCLTLSATSSCTVSRDEVGRISNPTGKVDAILIETNGGATTSFGYEVFLVPRGKSTWFSNRIVSLYGALRSDQAYGANLKWESASTLAVEYLKARREILHNVEVSVGDQKIHVLLKSGVNDSTAPPGGMLYNLQGRPYG